MRRLILSIFLIGLLALPASAIPPDGTGGWKKDASGNWSNSGSVVIGTTGVNPARMTSKLSMTNGATNTAITAAQILSNYWISNQGDTVETDVSLPAVSYPISVAFIVEEALVIEVCPPTDELFDLDGTDLDANDCVDSPAVVGSKLVATRIQIATGAWRWSLDTVRGTWTDTGATD